MAKAAGKPPLPPPSTSAPLLDSTLSTAAAATGCRPQAWKHALQYVLCNRDGLRVRVAHYPSGCSKWNPIEHRLFSFLSGNWQGKPLDSFATILNYIRSTTTRQGLELTARRITRQYARGIRISDEQMACIPTPPGRAGTTSSDRTRRPLPRHRAPAGPKSLRASLPNCHPPPDDHRTCALRLAIIQESTSSRERYFALSPYPQANSMFGPRSVGWAW